MSVYGDSLIRTATSVQRKHDALLTMQWLYVLRHTPGEVVKATVARHGEHSFMVMSGIAHTRRDHDYLRRHIADAEDVRLRDVTTTYAVLAIAGPHAPDLLGNIMNLDISDESFPPYHLRHAQIGHAHIFAQRLSFTGETGWEIFVTPDFAEHVLETILKVGDHSGLRLAGGEALNALRIETGFLHWGADMAYSEAPHQMGLDFTCKTDKPSPFIGQDKYLARKAEQQGPYLRSVRLTDNQAILHHNEPVVRNGQIIGFVTSGAFCTAQVAAAGLCLVSTTKGSETIEDGPCIVMVEGHEVKAELRCKPFAVWPTKRDAVRNLQKKLTAIGIDSGVCIFLGVVCTAEMIRALL